MNIQSISALTTNPIISKNNEKKAETSVNGFLPRINPKKLEVDVFTKTKSGHWVGKEIDENGKEVIVVTKNNWNSDGVLDSVDTTVIPVDNQSVAERKIVDYEHNTVSKGVVADPLTYDPIHKSMVTEKKDLITGKTVAKEQYEMSEIPGIYNVTETDILGRKKVLTSATKRADGGIYISKNLTSLDGTKTTYRYSKDANGDHIRTFNQITDKNGKVLSTTDRTFDRINENLSRSSINGRHYTIEHKEDRTIVTDEFENKQYTLKAEDFEMTPEEKFQVRMSCMFSGYMPEESDKPITKDLFRMFPGDVLIKMQEDVKSIVALKDPLDSAFISGIGVLNSTTDDFVISHELGHSQDAYLDEEAEKINKEYEKAVKEGKTPPEVLQNPIADNPQFIKEYVQEKAMFIKAFPEFKEEYVDYFIYGTAKKTARGRKEVVAETNAMNCQTPVPPEMLAMRTQVLQQYFPRTIAVATKLTTPIAVNDGNNRNNAGDIIVAKNEIYVPKIIVA